MASPEMQVMFLRANVELEAAVRDLSQYVIENKLDCNVLLKCDQVAALSAEMASIVEGTYNPPRPRSLYTVIGLVLLVAPWVIGAYQIVKFIKG